MKMYFVFVYFHRPKKRGKKGTTRKEAENIPEFVVLQQMDLRHLVSVWLMNMSHKSGKIRRKDV